MKKKVVKKGSSIKTLKVRKPKTPTSRTGISSGNGGVNIYCSDRQLVLSFPGTVTPTGLILRPTLEIGEWAPIGMRLKMAKEWLQFAIGDWLNHGETHYGETYVQAATATGLPEETLMIFKYVASRVDPETRIIKDNVTWSHHREIAKFPPDEQARWLKKAHKEGWSVRDLKDALKKAAGKDEDGQEEGGVGKEEGPPTGEGCEACGSSPAGMRACGSCMVLVAKALETIGIKGAMDLLRRKPSNPQLAMLKWAYDYVQRPEIPLDEQAQLEWEARYEALGKVAARAT